MSAVRRKILYKCLLTKALLAMSFAFCFAQHVSAAELSKTVKTLMLGETAVNINIYETKNNEITFFAPHYNERPGAETTKKLIAEKGGRLIEIESLDANGNPLRNLRFNFQNESYSVDPNRIFTANGRKCSNFSPETNALISNFAAELLKIIITADHNKHIPIVAVHNNKDVNDKELSERNQDLTATSFVRPGVYDSQVQGVYLSNVEPDADNFIFLSTPEFLAYFAEKDFNVAIQKPSKQLFSENCQIDDGSLSVYFGQKNVPYINLEADIKYGSFRQRQMLETVYLLIEKIKKESEPGKK